MATDELREKLDRAAAGARTPPPAPTTSGDEDAPSSVEFVDEDGGDGTPTEEEFGDPFAWQDGVVNMLEDEFLAGAVTLGWNEELAEGWFNAQKVDLVNYLETEIVPAIFQGENVEDTAIPGSETSSLMNLDILGKFGRQWLSSLAPEVRDAFNPNLAGDNNRTPSNPGPGGTTRSGLTPEQIRNQFDIDQLSEAVTNQWRGMLLDRPQDPRGIASAYVDAVVASGGQKKIDFDTFVLGRIRKDPRYNEIYKNKPPGLSEAQFLQPYVNTATQVLRPKNVAETARAGAQLGASPGAFRERLSRSEEATASAPFINSMEARMTDLSKVFRG